MTVSMSIDMNRCHIYAQCVRAAPEIFELTEGGHLQVTYPDPEPDRPQEQLVARLREAARVCPTRAISVESP